MAGKWFVEESLPDGRYQVVKRDMDLPEAIELMQNSNTANRLEMWSQQIGESSVYAPSAIRVDGQVLFDPVLSMLYRVASVSVSDE